MDEMYTKKVKDHFFHPRNVGEIKNPDGFGKVGSGTLELLSDSQLQSVLLQALLSGGEGWDEMFDQFYLYTKS